MLCAEFLAAGVRGLADDLQQALYCEPPDPVLVLGVPAKLDDRADFVGGVQDVGNALIVPAAHRSMSLSGLSSPRAAEPKRRTLLA
jgi:hypothetical protein